MPLRTAHPSESPAAHLELVERETQRVQLLEAVQPLRQPLKRVVAHIEPLRRAAGQRTAGQELNRAKLREKGRGEGNVGGGSQGKSCVGGGCTHRRTDEAVGENKGQRKGRKGRWGRKATCNKSSCL
eukprot:362231-Chlamydomonas_euryale.AAC.1